jgi:hypothetical protein
LAYLNIIQRPSKIHQCLQRLHSKDTLGNLNS